MAVVFAVLIYALFPGRFDGDSADMYHQSASLASIADWQSPLLTVSMMATREFIPGPAVLFVAQLTTWLFGLWLFTDAVIRRGKPWTGQLISIGCATPLVSFIFLDVNKDTAMAALGMLFVGILGRIALLGKRPTLMGYVGLALLGVVFVDLRHNAFIALFPLIAALLTCVVRTLRGSLPKLLAASLLITVALIGADGWVKYKLIGVARSHEERALIVFDLAGIAHYSHKDPSGGLLGPGFVARADACYTPKWQDPFEWGPCRDYGARLADEVQSAPGRKALYQTWVVAVVTHPIAYVHHRLAFFNELMRIDCKDCKDTMSEGVTFIRP